MALKAVYKDKYRSKGSGQIVLRYLVSGTQAEIAEYKAIQQAQANRAEWPEENGQPIYFVPINNLMRQGRNPQPSINLIKSYDGTRIFEDTSAEDVKAWTKRNELKDKAIAELQAKIEMGIDVGQMATAGFARAVAAQPAQTAPAAQPDLADEIAAGIGQPTTTEGEPATVGEGTGTLAD
jgi:hypothetical protein